MTRTGNRNSSLVVCVVFILILIFAVAFEATAQDYKVTKLPTLGGKLTRAFGVNNQGQVVGQSDIPNSAWHAFVWNRTGGIQDLGTLGGPFSVAYAINDSGQVVGGADDIAGNSHAFLWSQSGGTQDLGTLGVYSTASGINNKGEVVGWSQVGPTNYVHAFYWTQPEGMRDLGTLGSELGSFASGINDNAQVVGACYIGDGSSLHAFLWTQAGGMQDLGTLGGTSSVAGAINNSGEIVGSSLTPSGIRHAFLWTEAAGMHDLGTPPGFTESSAVGINSGGQIVGFAWAPNVRGSPFIWTKTEGMKALGPFGQIPLSEGNGINQFGLILTSLYTGSAYSSYLLVPVMSTILESSPNPSLVGQTITLTANVGSTVVGAPPDGENVTFFDGRTTLGVVPLKSGVARLQSSRLAAGTHALQGSYAGDVNYLPSKSAALLQAVNAYPTSAVIASSLNPSPYGQAVTWTTKVTASGPTAPTGNVAFRWSRDTQTYTIGTAPVNASGVATLTRSNLNADPFGAPYPLVAVYSGDAFNLGSTSAVLLQDVLQTKTAATITSSLNPSKLAQPVTFTAKIISPTVMPTGPVTFSIGYTNLGTAQLSGGTAKFTTSALPVGASRVKVTYYGNSNIAKSSASILQTVQ
jgi:probable HAF family extracellular repeat protein